MRYFKLAARRASKSRADSARRIVYAVIIAATPVFLSAAVSAAPAEGERLPAETRIVIPVMENWRHATGELTGAETIDFDDRGWTEVNLPHSYNTADGADAGGYYRGVAWYRKSIVVPQELAGKRIWLQFEGVSFTADVFIDGVQLRRQHRGGFSTFNFDATSQLPPGPHVVAVKVDNSSSLEQKMPPQAGDYTKAGGIYRDVNLIAVDPVHFALDDYLADTDNRIATPGVFWTTTDVSRDSAVVLAKVKLDNQSATPRKVEVTASVSEGDPAVVRWQQTVTCTLGAGEQGHTCDLTGELDLPRLWNGRIDPFCYDANVEIRDPETGRLVDEMGQRLGIRSFVFDSQRGFLLNGAPYQLRGANAHQCELAKGWARSDADVRGDIDLMLEMGATVVRTSHYPPNQAFFDYADQKGLVVYTEVPINGTTSGGRVPGGSDFLNAARDQMRELIRQNYNHPSIALWGLYNEISSRGSAVAVIKNLQSLTKEEERLLGNLDPSAEPMRRTTAATWSGLDPLATITDTIGLNRYYGWYEDTPAEEGLSRELDRIHRDRPEVVIGIAEYGGGANTQQHEAFNPVVFASAPNDKRTNQWHSETRQAWIHEAWWSALNTRDFLCYRLVWQMFDSASDGRNEGAQPGINDKGLVTADRKVRKDAYYYYKANWNDLARDWANEPVLHIADRRWTVRKENNVQVRAYSNLKDPALSLNGKPLGKMRSLGVNTYSMDVTLGEGENTIGVAAEDRGTMHKDSVVWIYRLNEVDESAASHESPPPVIGQYSESR